MPREDFESISLPKDMLKYIDELRKTNHIRKKYFFTSRAQFIRHAITLFFEKLLGEERKYDKNIKQIDDDD